MELFLPLPTHLNSNYKFKSILTIETFYLIAKIRLSFLLFFNFFIRIQKHSVCLSF